MQKKINIENTPGPQKNAIFLDRDGTIIEDQGFLHSPQQIQLLPDAIKALQILQKKYQLFIITNQSGVAKGKITIDQVKTVNQHLHKLLSQHGIAIKEWYVCPHQRRDNCQCIKPKAYFALKAAKDHSINLKLSFVIGDHPHDTFTANEQGVYGLYLLTGHGGHHITELPLEKPVFHRLLDAARWILNHPEPTRNLDLAIQKAAAAIRDGKVCAFPTETVYGLGADVFQPDAVEKIFQIKQRPHYNPLIAHIADSEQLHQLAESVPEKAQILIDTFWPGPLTLVLPKRPVVPDIVTGGNPSIAIRMPAHPIARKLIQRTRTPIAAPSANKFTCTSPTTADHVREQLGGQCPIIIDGGACRVGLESTIISFISPTPTLLRPGGIPLEDITECIGEFSCPRLPSENLQAPESPGLLLNHYAPATPLKAYRTIPTACENHNDIGILLFQPTGQIFAGPTEILTHTGDTHEAAANFFAALRRLDALGLKEIIAQYAPDHGLGNAINNRLEKAAKGRNYHEE